MSALSNRDLIAIEKRINWAIDEIIRGKTLHFRDLAGLLDIIKRTEKKYLFDHYIDKFK
jgi:glutamine phosphoribosylpyrophosphate amidotransferase